MARGFETGSDNERIDELQRQLDDVLDSQINSVGGNDNISIDSTRGSRNDASGDAGGIRSNEPIPHNITDVDEGGTPTGVFDKINIISSMAIIQHTLSTFDLRFIQGTVKDGARIKITPKIGQTGTIKSGGNILTSSDIVITDTEYYELVKYSEAETGVTGGAYKIFKIGGDGGLSEPVILGINALIPQTLPTITPIAWNTKNPHTALLSKAVEFTFTNLPPSGSYEGILVIIDIDSVGGFASPIWPISVVNPPVIPTTPLSRFSVLLYTIDGGTVVTNATSVGSSTGGGNVPAGTAQFQHLEWSGTAWIAQQTLAFGATSGNSGNLRVPNNIIGLSWRNISNDGNLEIKVDSGDFFDLTESNNGPVKFQLRAQDAVQDDNQFIFTQFSGLNARSEISAADFGVLAIGATTDVLLWDENKIDVNKNILPVAGDGILRIGNTTAPNRFLGMHAAEFGFDLNRRLNFGTFGGTLTLDGVGDTFTISIDSAQRALFTSSITELSGNVKVLANLDIGGFQDFPEIATPANPAANFGRLYVKDVAAITTLFFRDSAGTETNLLVDTGANTFLSNLDSPTAINQFINMGTNAITFNPSSVLIGSPIADVLNIQFPAGGSLAFLFNAVQEWSFSEFSAIGPNLILNNTLLINDSGFDPVADGIFSRNGGNLILQIPTFQIQRETTGTSFGDFNLTKVDAAPSGGEPIYKINFNLFDSPTSITYAQIQGRIVDVTDAGALISTVRADGGNINVMSIEGRAGTPKADILFLDQTIIKATSGGKIGLFVTDDPSNLDSIGSEGSNQMPRTAINPTTLNDLNARFGNFDGMFGVATGLTEGVWIKLSSNRWGRIDFDAFITV